MQSLHSTAQPLALALVLLISLQAASPTSCCKEEEKGSLLQFLAGLSRQRDGGGGGRLSWLESTDCCTWEGITCGEDGAVIDVSLPSRSLEGTISPSLAHLAALQRLNLSNNRLTGAIPGELSRLHFLSVFDVSNNDLEGPVPHGGHFNCSYGGSSYAGNPKLRPRCGSASTIPTSSVKQQNRKAVLALALGVFFGGAALLLLLGRVLLVSVSRRMGEVNTELNNEDDVSSEQRSADVEVIRMPDCKFADILKATNGFHDDNIIGGGGCGLVYKAELPDGHKLAIKRLHGDIRLTEREFGAEIDALYMARHQHLVPLWGYCVKGNSSFLIYSFMENGSLDDRLHASSSLLDWPTRFEIARGASRGISYIHHDCKPHIVHRDIKSSNILLDREFRAYVADFGLARLMNPNQSHVTTELAGSIGYIPPEYGQSPVATLRGDVYSFGVVLLELLTGRRPFFCHTGTRPVQELVSWVRQMRSRDLQIQVLDPTLGGRGYEEQMLEVLQVAWKCLDCVPQKRPTIVEVVSCLDSIMSSM